MSNPARSNSVGLFLMSTVTDKKMLHTEKFQMKTLARKPKNTLKTQKLQVFPLDRQFGHSRKGSEPNDVFINFEEFSNVKSDAIQSNLS